MCYQVKIDCSWIKLSKFLTHISARPLSEQRRFLGEVTGEVSGEVIWVTIMGDTIV